MKILIVAAWPTGLTAALGFANRGIVPDIVDAKEYPSKLSRAVGILPRSIEILNELGAGKRIVDEAIEAHVVTIQRNGKTILSVDLSKFLDGKERFVSLPQDRTESLMSERLEEMGTRVQYNTRVVNVESNNEGTVTVTFEDGAKKEYDWVVGADGVKSAVRESVGIKYEGYELEEEWSIADVEVHSDYNEREFRAWLLESDHGEKDAMIMVPIGPKRVRLISSTPDSIKALPIRLDLKEIRRSGTFKISIRQAEQYVKGRVALAGDAAHAHSPVGGRGMNLGIEDAFALVDAIINNTTSEYAKSRKRRAGNVIRVTEFVRKTLVSESPIAGFFITILAWCIEHSDTLKAKFAHNVARL